MAHRSGWFEHSASPLPNPGGGPRPGCPRLTAGGCWDNLLVESLANLELGGISDITGTRPRLGVSVRSVSLLPASVRELLKLPDEGVVVLDVQPNGPADKAGLRGSQTTVPVGTLQMRAGGDVIVGVNGVKITNTQQLSSLVTYESMVGETLEVAILRSGEDLTVEVLLELTPPE